MNVVVLAFSVGGGLSLVLAVMVLRRSRALRRRQRSVLSSAAGRSGRSSVLPSLHLGQVLAAVASGPRWLALLLAFVSGALVGYVLGGVVAAIALGVYAMVAAVFVRRRRIAVARRATKSALLDRLTGLAADLRAGLPVQSATRVALVGGSPQSGLTTAVAVPGALPWAGPDALPWAGPDDGLGRGKPVPDENLLALAQAAVTLAERTGAPLADLIDRIEADARAGDRARAAATAQAAGAQATAFLLAALPVGGLALGYAIGADPLAILLRTPLGAGCALGAVALQILGLTWSQRLQPRLS